ncbi:MAG TPA: PAS domain S-box protein, partial [Lacipirellulaceae bacterium]|nr:PAS domain S-box protein [Lacipirellulaceae bacterium]
MPHSRKPTSQLLEENTLLRAQVAQLKDRIDHLLVHGAATKSLQQTEAFHREIMSAVSDAVLLADETGRLKYVSPNAHLIFGHSAADILKQGRINFALPSDLYDPDLLERRGEISNIECQIRDAVGRARNLLVTARRFRSPEAAVMFVCRDATERVKIKLDYELLSLTLERRVNERTADLRESRDRYRRLVENLREDYLFYATDQAGVITYISPSIHNILGYTPDQVLGRNWREFVDANNPGYVELERMERMRFAGLDTPAFTAWVRHANGEDRLLEFRDSAVRDADGRVIANEGIGKNITQRYQNEEALRRAREELQRGVQEATAELTRKNEELQKSKELYRSVIQDHLEFIVRWREDGTRTFVNDAYSRYCNAPPEDLVGTCFISSILEEDRDSLQQKLAALSVDNPVVVHEHQVVKDDGRIAWEHWTHRAL